jgi:hypothetical protein
VSTKRGFESVDPVAVTSHEGSEASDQHGQPDLDRLPDVLYAADLARIYRLSLKRIYALASEGAFTFCEIKPRLGRQAYARERIRQHVRGELRGLTVSPRKRSA